MAKRKIFFCGGAGFLEPPQVKKLNDKSQPPQTYSQGLMGGKGYDFEEECCPEGGFGGGGASIFRQLNGQCKYYYGSGGGYTGGSCVIRDDQMCDGGGGGSFAADPDAIFDYQLEDYGKCIIKFLN